MQEAPIIGIGRHRLAVDGQGVTTLVAFHGCTLHCKYCINSQCLDPNGVTRIVSTDVLLQELSIDNLYFLATGGGVTFGGGEPCIRSLFIEEFAKMKDSLWKLNIETSLHVGRHHIDRLIPYVDQWIIDIKDTDPKIFHDYTGGQQSIVDDNLRHLLTHEGMADRLLVRLPLIPDYNDEASIQRSRSQLSQLGIKHFDIFNYRI